MNAIFDYLVHHHDTLLYIIAGLSLLVELTVIGLSGPLLFFAIACAITAVLVSLNIVSSWEMELLLVGLFTLLSSVLMWKPLKRFQGSGHVSDNSSDMIGQNVPVSEVLTQHGGSIRFSGINWTARLSEDSSHESIAIGEYVKIHAVDGNIMIIK
ncbi:MAG: NfeD family protein [Psychromonas sp.]